MRSIVAVESVAPVSYRMTTGFHSVVRGSNTRMYSFGQDEFRGSSTISNSPILVVAIEHEDYPKGTVPAVQLLFRTSLRPTNWPVEELPYSEACRFRVLHLRPRVLSLPILNCLMSYLNFC